MVPIRFRYSSKVKKKKIDLQILISDYITGGAINHGGVLTDREVANPSI